MVREKNSFNISKAVTIGTIYSFLLWRKNGNIPNRTDLFFIYGIIFLIIGLFILVNNSGFFNSIIFSMKKITNTIYKKENEKRNTGEELSTEYRNFVYERIKNPNYKINLSIGVVLLLLSFVSI